MSSFYHIIFLLTLVFWIWMLIDCWLNTSLRGGRRLIWLLLVLLVYPFGAIVYFFVGRSWKARRRRMLDQRYYPVQQEYISRRALSSPSYEAGYQPAQERRQSTIQRPLYEEVDQPHATYPDMTQEQRG